VFGYATKPAEKRRRWREFALHLSKAYNRYPMERSRDWMDQAQGDLGHAQHDLAHGFYDWACFSAQQAAEKAVKAVFQKLGAEAWGHSVADLLKELAHRYPVSEELINGALELDKVYIPARYPNAHPSGSPRERYTKNEAARLIQYAEQIIKFCESLLSQAEPR
jgi:HEPN domain-containing protein